MNPSERIRAALSRPEGGRPASEPAVLEPVDSAQRTRPAIEVSEEVLAALSGSRAATAEPAAGDAGVDVETTLPLIGAGEPKRAHAAAAAQTAAPLARDSRQLAAKGQPAARVEERSKRPSWILPVGAGIAVVAGVCVFLVLRPHWAPTPRQSAANTSATAAPLQLQVEAAGSGLIGVRWNAKSAAVAEAREGRLIVTGADQQPRTMALDSEQLKGGHILYQSSADRLEFRLEVYERSGAIEKESVVALARGAAAPAVAPAPLKAQGVAPPVNNGAQANLNLQGGDAPQNAKALDATPARPPARAFTAPPPQEPSAEAPRVVVLDPSAAVSSTPTVPQNMIFSESLSRGAPPPIKEGAGSVNQVSGAVSQIPRAVNQIKVGGDLQAAKLIRRVTPAYPPLARSAHIQGAVRFTATIGKDGVVRNLRVVNGPRMLVQAASDAVKQWIYRPTTLNGQAVEVLTQIEVNFSLVE